MADLIQTNRKRVLLDNCVPVRLARDLPEYTVSTAIACGWAGLSDTELLDAMDGKFDALITVDKSIRHQQRLDGRTFGLVVLRAKSNRLATLRRLVPALLVTLPLIKPGEICEISE